MLRAPVLVQDGVRLLLLERLLLLTEDLAQAGVRHLGETEEMVFLAVFWEFFELNLRHMAEVGVRHLGRDGRNEFFGF